jgi:hypothetical protein
MTPSAWIALGSLAVALGVHAVVVAFMMGKLVQRVSNVEREVGDRASMNDTVIELKVKMGHVETEMQKQSAALEGIHRQLGNIAMNRIGLAGELK